MTARRTRSTTAGEHSKLADEWSAQPAQPSAGDPASWETAGRTLSSRRQSVTVARNFTTKTLGDWGLAELCDEVELVVSELVTNALRALSNGRLDEVADAKTSPPPTKPDPQREVHLKLVRKTRHVMCLVADPSDEPPCCQPLGDDPELLNDAGRGLYLVEAYSLRWGWARLRDGGKVVWALFHAPE